MAFLVVDALEVVEVDEQQRRRRREAGVAAQPALEPRQRMAVQEAGQRIVMGRPFQPLRPVARLSTDPNSSASDSNSPTPTVWKQPGLSA